MQEDWYTIKNINLIDSPALAIYPDRVKENIGALLSMIDNVNRLRPHVKTHKSLDASKLLLEFGIHKFKCATIAEAEMLAIAGATDILLAYQPSRAKTERFISLIKKYRNAVFSCLVDNISSAKMLAEAAVENSVQFHVYIDLNVGMNRTGIVPGNEVIELYKYCNALKVIIPLGLHVYDGHIRTKNLELRKKDCDEAFAPVKELQKKLVGEGFEQPVIIAGGSPTFPIHAARKEIECSPGTFIFWDYGHQENLEERDFRLAALVIARIISKPAAGKICIDLGHKSIASENDLCRRVFFLNAPNLKFTAQSEEHLVAETTNDFCEVGDVLYGVPYHICPTVALYETCLTIQNQVVSGEWKIAARDRKINV